MSDLHNDNEETRMAQASRIRATAGAFRQAQVLFTCLEMKVFEHLRQGSAEAARLAEKTDASLRGMELLLNAAVSQGYLHKQGQVFTNSCLTEAFLLEGVPGSMTRNLGLQAAFYHRWGGLEQAVRSGQRPEENRKAEEPPNWIHTFVHGLYNHARQTAPLVARKAADVLGWRLDAPLRVIDVGGCHGAYCMALCDLYPNLTAVVYELPRVVPVARELISTAAYAERVIVQAGNFQEEELGEGYDLALVFGILNGEPPALRPQLIDKVFRALNPGGVVFLRDMLLSQDRTSPPEAALFALQMLLATEDGGLDTNEDWAAWLLSAGFAPPQEISIPGGSVMTMACKPQ